MSEVKKDPLGKHAAYQAAQLFNYGDMIPMDWLYDQMEFSFPKRGSPEEFKKLQFKWLYLVEQFKEVMLTDFQMALKNVRGEGYQIILPHEQTDEANAGLRKALDRECRKSTKKLYHVNRANLTDAQVKHNLDSLGRVAAVRSFAMDTVIDRRLGRAG